MNKVKSLDDRYRKIDFVGEGQYAMVYRAEDIVEKTIVAIKKIKMNIYGDRDEGVNQSAIREIKTLKQVVHENIIRLLNVYGNKKNINLVYEYMNTDLLKIIEDPTASLSFANVKSYILMTLKGVEYLHQNFILHRDLKPSNLLINSSGVLKLGDLGLARSYGQNRALTSLVVTRWYRAPELLYGSRFYDGAIDIWSVGCVLCEMLKREPIFPGSSDLDQLTRIFNIRGSPTLEDWPCMDKLPDYVSFNPVPKIKLGQIFTAAGNDLLDFLECLLTINPNDRVTATEALKHEYFYSEPRPTPSNFLIIVTPTQHSRSRATTSTRKRTQTELTEVRKKIKF